MAGNEEVESGNNFEHNLEQGSSEPDKADRTPMSLRNKIFAAIGIIIFLFVLYVVVDANKYRAMVRVVEGEGRVGVNPTTEALDFGDLSRGTSAVRRVDIKNGTGIPVYIVIFKTGSISDLVDINRNFFKLRPGEEQKIEFSVYMPASAEIDKTYGGRVFLFRVPVF